MAQMRLFEKESEEMSLAEARAAYDHAVRNLSFVDIEAIEAHPHACDSDSAHRALCKRLVRRIRALE